MTAILAEPVRAAVPDTTRLLPARPRSARPDRRRWQDGPTPASLTDLVALTRDVADDVAAGLHDVQVESTPSTAGRSVCTPTPTSTCG